MYFCPHLLLFIVLHTEWVCSEIVDMIDDEEEYEDVGRGSRFLGFMFGNVNDSGGLDADYLDEVSLPPLISLSLPFMFYTFVVLGKQWNLLAIT